jgi:hypothetical protein
MARSQTAIRTDGSSDLPSSASRDAQRSATVDLCVGDSPPRPRVSLDRHATYIVAAYLAGAAR